MGAKPSRPVDTTSTRQIETVTGSHEFKVEGYSFDKESASGVCLTSAVFTIGEYDWAIIYYPNGSSEEDKDNIAFFLMLQSDAKNVKTTFKLSLLNHSKKQSKMEAAFIKSNPKWKGSTWGYRKFIERKAFEKSEYLKDNSFVIQCSVTVLTSTHLDSEPKIKPVIIRPSDLDRQLHYLLKSGQGADVSFEVGGEIFKAHKLILGARSRVFHAQFSGHMKEKWAECIKLDNIETEVFRVFLDFVYSDSLPKLEETIDARDVQTKIIMYQHLLVAADRYEIERLKLICEYKLSQNIEMQNFSTTLTLAEQHDCSQLKASCLQFASSPKKLVAIMATEGFDHLTRSCPSIVKELLENSNKNE